MSTFQQKTLFAALVASGVLGSSALAAMPIYSGNFSPTAGPASSVHVTAVTVVNVSSSAKAVKVSFLEGANSKEILDFNLYLQPRDVWTAATQAKMGVLVDEIPGGASPVYQRSRVKLPEYALHGKKLQPLNN